MALQTVDVSAVWIEEGISQRRFSKLFSENLGYVTYAYCYYKWLPLKDCCTLLTDGWKN